MLARSCRPIDDLKKAELVQIAVSLAFLALCSASCPPGPLDGALAEVFEARPAGLSLENSPEGRDPPLSPVATPPNRRATKGDAGSGWIADRIVDTLEGPSESPTLTAGPNDRLHAAWTQDAGGGDRNIYYASSSDFGLTWTAPVSVASALAGILADSPDIHVQPNTGRVFIAHAQRHVMTGARSVWLAYSDDGVNWQLAEVHANPINPGSPKVVTSHGSTYHVYVVYEHVNSSDESDLFVRRASSTGLPSWSTLECIGCLADSNVYADPDIAFHVGADAHPRMFVSYVSGADDPSSVELYWYDQQTSTEGFSTIRNESPTLATSPTIAASRNGDSLLVAWIRHDAGDGVVRWAYQTNPVAPMPAWTLGTPNINTAGKHDFAPNLAADGDGSGDNTIGGDYHLTYHYPSGFGFDVAQYRSIPTAVNSGWTTVVRPEDGAHGGADSGIATQLRSGRWYPAILYHDFLPAPVPDGRSDIYYVTPGGLRVETDPPGGRFTCCGPTNTTYTSPHVFADWVAGTARVLEVPSPQSPTDGVRYIYRNWSDGGSRRHTVVHNATVPYQETHLTANLDTEYRILVETDPPNLVVLVDDQPVVAPQEFWWEEGSTHTVEAHKVSRDFEFNRWLDDGPRVRTFRVTQSETYTAQYVSAPFPVVVLIAVGIVVGGLVGILLLRQRKSTRVPAPPSPPAPTIGEKLPEEWQEEPEGAGPLTEEELGDFAPPLEPSEMKGESTLAVQESRVDEIAGRIAELEQLRAEGLITDAEYQEKRKLLLEGL